MRNSCYLLGAITGDICGSSYERSAGRTKEYDKVVLKRFDNSFTDDTVCTIGIANAILKYGNPTSEQFAECLVEMCRKYPDRGYGSNFQKWIDNPVPYDSYGNGSAMRVSPVGFWSTSVDQCLSLAANSADCSHNHPEGINGAQAIALSIFYAKKSDDKSLDSVRWVLDWKYPQWASKTLDEIRPDYTFKVSCQESVPVAILAFLESSSYEDCIKKAISMGGDSDTLAAMAGGIAYAYYKEMPFSLSEYAADLLTDDIEDTIIKFDEALMCR